MVWIGWTVDLRFYKTGKSEVGLQHGILSTNLPSPLPLLEAKDANCGSVSVNSEGSFY